MRLSLLLSLPLFVGCFGRSANNSPDKPSGGSGSETGDGGSPSGGGASGGAPASGGRDGTGGMSEAAFACACPEGSDFGVHLSLSDGEVLVFDQPPRFHDPDASENITWEFDCDAPETPIYFDTACTAADLLEACHAERGCLQIKKTTFVWLDNDGAELVSGPADFEWDLIGGDVMATLDHMEGSLGSVDSPLGTFVAEVCRLARDDCLK